MTRFAEASPEERDLIPNVMQPSPRNSKKREEIDYKRVIHALNMKNRDKYQSSLMEEAAYTMHYVPKTRQYTMLTNMRISFLYIEEIDVQ